MAVVPVFLFVETVATTSGGISVMRGASEVVETVGGVVDEVGPDSGSVEKSFSNYWD